MSDESGVTDDAVTHEAPWPQAVEAPPLRQAEEELYGAADARRDQQLRLITLARLPEWERPTNSNPVPTGHGWGYHLDGLLGHGIARGELVAIAADRAGAGKTALLAQLVDGLITRSMIIALGLQPEQRWGDIMTPVLLFSEMSPAQLAWRSGARWLGVNSQAFRGGLSYVDRLRSDGERELNAQEWDRLVTLLSPRPDVSLFGAARRHWLSRFTLRTAFELMDADTEGFGDLIVSSVRDWAGQLLDNDGHGLQGTVRPVIVIDPVQRSQRQDLLDVDALNKLARMLRTRAQEQGWIVLMTSDTNKASAIGQARRETSAVEEAAAAFRGSYGLQHELSTALYIRRPPTVRKPTPLEVEIIIPKSRWGRIPKGTPDDPWPRYEWYPEYLRFVPLSEESTKERANLDAEANEAAIEERKKGKVVTQDDTQLMGLIMQHQQEITDDARAPRTPANPRNPLDD